MKELLFAARQEGGLVVCTPVYAELFAYTSPMKDFVNGFLKDTKIEVYSQLRKQ